MTAQSPDDGGATATSADDEMEALPDPRAKLAEWANGRDEWTRYIVRLVLETGKPLATEDIEAAFQLFLEEKGFVKRSSSVEPELTVEASTAADEDVLRLLSISDVTGVNALISNPEIELHEGLTIFYGENGTGKTGYARILKSLANSRTADEILPNIDDPAPPAHPSATIKYSLGGVEYNKVWMGEPGAAPFTRMSVFDTPAVNIHVDDDITYVFTPASLALFNHVSVGIQGVQAKLVELIASLRSSNNLLGRFSRGTGIYGYIETLGASTDLAGLDELLRGLSASPEEDVEKLESTLGALKANTTSEKLRAQQRSARVLDDGLALANALLAFSVAEYNASLKKLEELAADYRAFRESLFEAADLPAEPEQTWERFVQAGSAYRDHLASEGVHDERRCLYCRQVLSDSAAGLVAKYRDYLEDKIATDIRVEEAIVGDVITPLSNWDVSAISQFLSEQDPAESSEPLTALRKVLAVHAELTQVCATRKPVDPKSLEVLPASREALETAKSAIDEDVADLTAQLSNTSNAIMSRTEELETLKAQITLRDARSEVEAFVLNSQKADKLQTLARTFKQLLTSLTGLSTAASDQLINNNFEQLFKEECDALRAKKLRLSFLGREAQMKRKKVVTGNHRPSKVLSEGEQKVLAIADFLAEARLTGIRAPIVFDDPVSSLDHRRLGEVADRITSLAESGQVVVFTHDILFATGLLARFEKSKRCRYYQVTDEPGTGTVSHATGPRWDTISNLKGKVNASIEAAKRASGEERAAHIYTAYDWIRSWCEVFVEIELLAGVTERYQPNVRMTALPKIKPGALQASVDAVTKVFDDACRYIDGHSQPLLSLGTAPTLSGLEDDWKTVQDARAAYLSAT